jgi:dihydrofolate synthase/folylpolyglutamate synthase
LSKQSNKWNLAQWLHDLENRHSQEIQLGLSRVAEVAKRLALQKPQCKVISVAGTNGKGSTVTALETMYHTAGYQVGAYTSPHLIHFNERIKVNLITISDEDLCHAFNLIEEARKEIELTYFEMTTLAALVHFKQQRLDVMIIEVGLGGRLDATNIIDADLAIITTIDYDHQDFLGNSLEAIGYEKAGILRTDTPYIYADINPPATIMEVAKKLSAPGYFYTQEFSFEDKGTFWNLNFLDHDLASNDNLHPEDIVPVARRNQALEFLVKPSIQLKSASAAIMATVLLQRDLPVSFEQLNAALSLICISGRLQLHKSDVSILYDVSHNPQSARLLADTVKQMENTGRVHAVFSALKDKDIMGLIFPLKDCVDLWYPAQLHNKRAATADILLSIFRNAEILVNICYTSPFIAFEEALKNAESGDLIIVFGSFFTVSHVMAAQHKHLEQKEI